MRAAGAYPRRTATNDDPARLTVIRRCPAIVVLIRYESGVTATLQLHRGILTGAVGIGVVALAEDRLPTHMAGRANWERAGGCYASHAESWCRGTGRRPADDGRTEGKHYRVEGLQLTPTPLQRPQIPLWIGGDWLVNGVRRRLVRWDGCYVYKGTPGTGAYRPMLAEDVRAIRSLVARERDTAAGFDICIGGQERGADWDRERDHIRSLAEAGATWWNEWVPPGGLEQMREAINRGPLRVD